jgi:hypothetical protein
MPALDWNAVRYDPATRSGHVESYFMKCNDPAGDRALWMKATIFASTAEPGRPIAEAWAIAFDRRGGKQRHVAVKHSVPYSTASFSATELAVRWQGPADPDAEPRDGIEILPGSTRGEIGHGGHRVAWSLHYDGDDRPIVPFPAKLMYSAPFPKSKLVTPVPDALFDGEATIDGETWQIEKWRGMQGHNWGKGHADLYAWCHGNVWEEDPEFILEGFSGQVRVGPVTTPLTTIVMIRHRGVVYDFNRPLDIYRASGDVSPRRWTFAAESKIAAVEGIVEVDTDDMVGLYYANPGGAMTYCLNSKLARARVRFEAAGRAPLTLTSRATALEIGTRRSDHGVRMYV